MDPQFLFRYHFLHCSPGSKICSVFINFREKTKTQPLIRMKLYSAGNSICLFGLGCMMSEKTIKKRFVVLAAVILLCVFAFAGVVSAIPGPFTATIVQPAGTTISPGDPVSIRIDGLADGQLLNLSISATGLVNTTASGYQVDFFRMPFTLKTGTLIATGTQVSTLQMEVIDQAGTDQMFHPAGGGPTITITERRDVTKQTYEMIKLSGTPSTNPPNVGTSLWANGTVMSADVPSWLNFTFQGATSGSFSLNVYQQDASRATGTYTISVPSGQTVSESKQTPSIPPGTTQPVTFTDQTSVALDITPNSAIPAGTTITVQEYSAPPADVTTAKPSSTYQVIGKYIVLEAPNLSGVIGTIRIKVYYTDAEVTGLDASTLRIYYFNTTAVPAAWEALPGGVDTTNKFIYGDSPHFSDYAAFGAPPTSGSSSNNGGGGGGGGSSGGSTGAFSRSAPGAPVGQLAPSGASAVTTVNGVGPLTSAPLTADLVNMPGVAVTWATVISDKPDANAKMTTAIQQTPSPVTLDAYTTALALAGKDIGSLAYVMVVQKTGITSTGPATVTMTAPQDWVTNNGGTDAISIVRMADDGTTEVLAATFDGYDKDSGYLTFKALSPNGLSTFGLVATVPHVGAAATAAQPTSAAPSGQQAPPQATAAGGLPVMTIIAGIIIILVVVGAGAFYYTRSKDSAKKAEKKK